jgi:hypothetical protein
VNKWFWFVGVAGARETSVWKAFVWSGLRGGCVRSSEVMVANIEHGSIDLRSCQEVLERTVRTGRVVIRSVRMTTVARDEGASFES